MIVQQKLGLTEGGKQLNIPEKQLLRQTWIKVNKATMSQKVSVHIQSCPPSAVRLAMSQTDLLCTGCLTVRLWKKEGSGPEYKHCCFGGKNLVT